MSTSDFGLRTAKRTDTFGPAGTGFPRRSGSRREGRIRAARMPGRPRRRPLDRSGALESRGASRGPRYRGNTPIAPAICLTSVSWRATSIRSESI